MPTVSVYIKNEDYVKWLAVENKSEFMHTAIENGNRTVKLEKVEPYYKESFHNEEPEEELSQLERHERGESYESMGYVYDPSTQKIYDADQEQTPGKVDKNGKIIELL